MKFLLSALIISLIINLKLYCQVQQEWIRIFDGQLFYYDEPARIVCDATGNIIMSGTSAGNENDLSWEYEYITIKYNSSGQQIWARTFNGDSGLTENVADMTIDINNNIFVTGYGFNGQTMSYDMMTVKYNATGQQIWMRAFGNQAYYDQPRAIKTDNNGNVYVLGNVFNPVTEDDVAILKYNNDGALAWSRIYNYIDSSYEGDGDLITDNNGNVYVTTTTSRLERSDAVILKYNSGGSLLWSSFYNPSNVIYDVSSSIALDNSANVYVSGYSQLNPNRSDVFLLKYNSIGQQLWVKTHRGPKYFYAFWQQYRNPAKILLDNTGNIFIVSGIVDSMTTYDKILLLKYNSQGTLLVSKSYTMPNCRDIYVREAILDRFNNIYITGSAQFIATSNNNDILTQKYNTNCDQVWSIHYNGPGEPYRNNDYGVSICLDSTLNVYVAGITENATYSSDIVTIKYSQTIGIEPISTEIPSKFRLYQNHPNPFNPTTKIKFDLPSSSFVKLFVYDILGRVVSKLVNENLKPGTYNIDFNSSELPSGIYFYSIATETQTETKKMVLIK